MGLKDLIDYGPLLSVDPTIDAASWMEWTEVSSDSAG